jgi:protein SCO1/2
MQRKIVIFVILVLTIPSMAFFLVTYLQNNHAAVPIYYNLGVDENGETKYHEVPDFTLTDHHGTSFSLEDVEGQILVVDFFFTHCPSICPMMTRNLQLVREAFGLGDEVAILSFTVDPERDDPERLSAYAKKFKAEWENWVFLTGEKKDLYWLARKGFYLSATDGDGGPNDFIHSENLVLVDVNRRIRGYYDGTKRTQVEQLIRDIQKLKRQKA